MTGPEHYHEAERLLAQAARWESNVVDDTDSYASIDAAIATAQAHATLALAAATAQGATELPADGPTASAWRATLTGRD